ncbi:hypothetical protein BSLA_02f0134 [Burkholderia stabilis]|nr:hypothetical protein BSLA_02f0134 [Burkholderia stabilis]
MRGPAAAGPWKPRRDSPHASGCDRCCVDCIDTPAPRESFYRITFCRRNPYFRRMRGLLRHTLLPHIHLRATPSCNKSNIASRRRYDRRGFASVSRHHIHGDTLCERRPYGLSRSSVWSR